MLVRMARASPDFKVPQPGEAPTPVVPETPSTPTTPDPVPAPEPVGPTIPGPDPERDVPIEPPEAPQTV